MTQKEKQIVSGLKKGQNIEVTTDDGMIRGVVQALSNMLVVITLVEPLTSKRAHSYHWDAGNLKSVLFKRMNTIKRVEYINSPIPN